jgi:hypothetical protein
VKLRRKRQFRREDGFFEAFDMKKSSKAVDMSE